MPVGYRAPLAGRSREAPDRRIRRRTGPRGGREGGAMRQRLAVLAAAALLAVPAVRAQVLFRDVTADAGIGAQTPGRTMAWGDYNNDGYPDFLVGCSKLYKNLGPPDFRFELVPAGLSGAHGVWADIDNDGDLDIYCPSGGDNDHLWINQGPAAGYTFVEGTDFDGDGTADMVDGKQSIAITWGDFDADGLVDVYVGSYERHCTSSVCGDCQINTMWHNLGSGRFEDVTVNWGLDAAERGLVNGGAGQCLGGGGTCTDDSDCAPFGGWCKSGLCARGLNTVDYDNDGDADIFVSDYRLDENMLLENDGSGHFSNVARTAGIDGHCGDGVCGHTLGADWGDMDNDGDLDCYAANLAHWWGSFADGHDISYLWRSENAGVSFIDVRDQSGMRPFTPAFDPENDWEEASAGWADIDNDGDLDIYVTDFYPFRKHWSQLYRNDGDGDGNGVPDFVDVSDPGNGDCPAEPDPINVSVGPTCLKRWYSWTAVWADYDRDGDLDLLTSGSPIFYQCDTPPVPPECDGKDPANRDTWPQPSYIVLFRNETEGAGHWLEVRLVGQSGVNRAALGARLTAHVDLDGDGTAETRMLREVSGGEGYQSSQDWMVQHFGLGPADRVSRLEVRWPAAGAPVSSFSDVPADGLAVVYSDGADLLRGTDPAALGVYEPQVALYPHRDPEPVLDDARALFYRVADDVTIDVTRDDAARTVVIAIRH
ncbi:MAG: CRTAC1 family protein [Acidobacteria bacterium]|nr:MAG: CRTAC1 family protein [Acidobacteriota bacterium]